jgi:hypothetical protein
MCSALSGVSGALPTSATTPALPRNATKSCRLRRAVRSYSAAHAVVFVDVPSSGLSATAQGPLGANVSAGGYSGASNSPAWTRRMNSTGSRFCRA